MTVNEMIEQIGSAFVTTDEDDAIVNSLDGRQAAALAAMPASAAEAQAIARAKDEIVGLLKQQVADLKELVEFAKRPKPVA